MGRAGLAVGALLQPWCCSAPRCHGERVGGTVAAWFCTSHPAGNLLGSAGGSLCPRGGQPLAEGCSTGRWGWSPLRAGVFDHGAGLSSPGEAEERRVCQRDEGEDERGGADRPHEAPPEWLHEGEAAQPAAAGQPAARHPWHEGTRLLQGGESLHQHFAPGTAGFASHGCSELPEGGEGTEGTPGAMAGDSLLVQGAQRGWGPS